MSTAVGAAFEQSWWSEAGSQEFEEFPIATAIERIQMALADRAAGDEAIVNRAVEKVLEAYGDQEKGRTGRLLVRHMLAVAKTVAEIGLDADAVAAALLHDVIEDSRLSEADLERMYGARVAGLVGAVSRYEEENGPNSTPHSEARNEASRQKVIFEKVISILSSGVESLPAVFIKLAEKLDHMRFSAQYFSYERRQDMAREVMDGYAPLAERLGVWQLKAELEDRAFRIQNPDAYNLIATQHAAHTRDANTFLRQAIPELVGRLERANLTVQVQVRQKHIYSTYVKMQRCGAHYRSGFDLIGLRIIVASKDECYAAVRIVHDLWKPVPNEFDDYIAVPKANGYQSLHSTVMSKEGFAMEVQIRTRKMHEIAEFGMAAHWRYKLLGGEVDESLSVLFDAWRKYVDEQAQAKDRNQFFKNLKDDLLQEQIHVFYLPTGELVSLPKGSTPVDLFYAIDDENAPRCVGARVGEFDAPLEWPLANGDRVMPRLTERASAPERAWYLFSRTSRVRDRVQAFYETLPRKTNIRAGREILLAELRKLGLAEAAPAGTEAVPAGTEAVPAGAEAAPAEPILDEIAARTGFSNLDELLESIGACRVNARNVADEAFRVPYRRSVLDFWARQAARLARRPVPKGVIIASRCCQPELGEPLAAQLSEGKMFVHCLSCSELASQPRAWPVRIPAIDPNELALEVTLRVKARDRLGLFNDITSILVDEAVNIEETIPLPGADLKVIELRVEIPYTLHLSKLIHRLALTPYVVEVWRVADSREKGWHITTRPGPADLRLQSLYPLPGLSRGFRPSGQSCVESSGEYRLDKMTLACRMETTLDRASLAEVCAMLERRLHERSEHVLLTPEMFGERPFASLVLQVVQYLDRRGALRDLQEVLEAQSSQRISRTD